MNIRLANPNEIDKCVEIASSLTDWFDSDDMIDIEKSLRSLPIYVCDDDGIVGIICIKEKSDKVVEIENIAVALEHQNKGVGTSLIAYIEDSVAVGRIIEVKTLDDSSTYEPYAKTRAFYEKLGFVKIETISPYPGWSESCPCAIYIKMPQKVGVC